MRPLEEGDLPSVVAWSQDPEINLLTDGGYPESLAEAESWFGKVASNRQTREYLICLADGTPIGNLSLVQISWRTGEAEVQIRIGEQQYWDRGLGAEALLLLFEISFERMRLNSLYLRVFAFNKRAIRCYEKVGFRRRGRVSYDVDGEVRELILMTIEKKRYLRYLLSA